MQRRDFRRLPFRGLRTASVLLAVLCALAGPGRADDDDDAEEAVEQGAVAPPAALFERIAGDFGGRVLRLELEHEDDGRDWVYDVKLLLADGQVIKVEYDAVTLEILEVKGRRHESSAEGDED
jgi:uncharacterized membrane protein YkoI